MGVSSACVDLSPLTYQCSSRKGGREEAHCHIYIYPCKTESFQSPPTTDTSHSKLHLGTNFDRALKPLDTRVLNKTLASMKNKTAIIHHVSYAMEGKCRRDKRFSISKLI